MANKLNLIDLKRGDVIKMSDGRQVKVLQNPGDGVWVFGFYLTDGSMSGEEGAEEPIFAQDIEELVHTAE